jgi:hypothetical protein
MKINKNFRKAKQLTMIDSFVTRIKRVNTNKLFGRNDYEQATTRRNAVLLI